MQLPDTLVVVTVYPGSIFVVTSELVAKGYESIYGQLMFIDDVQAGDYPTKAC
jgi:hypothetical protein